MTSANTVSPRPHLPRVPLPGFAIDADDAAFRARMPPEEWDRLIWLRSLPDFFPMIGAYHAVMSPEFAENRTLNLLMSEAARFRMLAYSLYLMQSHDRADRTSGFTVSKLRRICSELQIASPGRVSAFIEIMLSARLIAPEKSALDGRITYYTPTPVLDDMARRWDLRMFEVTEALLPRSGVLAQLARDPAVGDAMRARAAIRGIAGFNPLLYFPEVDLFSSRDGGWTLLFAIAYETCAQGTLEVPVSIQLDAFGQTHGGSRSHLRRVLCMAYEAGLLAEDPVNGRRIRLTERMLRAFFAYFALYVENYISATIEACGLSGARAGRIGDC